jgi:hypothetical protein
VLAHFGEFSVESSVCDLQRLLQILQLLEDQGAIDDAIERGLVGAAATASMERLQLLKALFFKDITLQYDVAIDDGDDAVEEHGVRRGLRLWRRSFYGAGFGRVRVLLRGVGVACLRVQAGAGRDERDQYGEGKHPGF